MYNLTKNNYHLKPKNSKIYTPQEVSEFIFELLRKKFPRWSLILDPCCGEGSLLRPWNWYRRDYFLVHGIDQEESNWVDNQTDFLTLTKQYFKGRAPSLVLCNPPFNGYGNKLGSEVWLDKIIELFGKEVPIVLFAPINFRTKENRWKKFGKRKWPAISSIINLNDTFEGIKHYSEILIFNIKGLQPHYFHQSNYE